MQEPLRDFTQVQGRIPPARTNGNGKISGMSATEILQRIGESLGGMATVKSVFGEPIRCEGKTVVPVAKVAYGFGGGFGGGTRKHGSEPSKQGEGGGGGGGVRAFPAGALEITATRTRFVPVTDTRWLAAAFCAGALLGSLVARRRFRH
jgi:uncharacterized spore protein YtfJ